jgi:hypothetical protein
VDRTELIFKDTKFLNNSCHDGCLAYTDGAKGIIMERVEATDNYALKNAALVYVDRNRALTLGESVDIKYS